MPTDEPETTPEVVEPAPEVVEPPPAKQPKPPKSKKVAKVKAILDEIDEDEDESEPEVDLVAKNQARKDRNAAVRAKVVGAVVDVAKVIVQAHIPPAASPEEAARLVAIAATKTANAGRRK
jgi:hypothetical protein